MNHPVSWLLLSSYNLYAPLQAVPTLKTLEIHYEEQSDRVVVPHSDWRYLSDLRQVLIQDGCCENLTYIW